MNFRLKLSVSLSIALATIFAPVAEAGRCTVANYEEFSALDVDGDGYLYPIDLLSSIVNPQNAGIIGKRVSDAPTYSRLDLDHNGLYTPLDILRLINLWNAKGSLCDVPKLKAYSKMDKAKRGTRIDSNEYLAIYYMIAYGSRAALRHGVPLFRSQASFDFNSDGKVDDADADIVREAYSRR